MCRPRPPATWPCHSTPKPIEHAGRSRSRLASGPRRSRTSRTTRPPSHAAGRARDRRRPDQRPPGRNGRQRLLSLREQGRSRVDRRDRRLATRLAGRHRDRGVAGRRPPDRTFAVASGARLEHHLPRHRRRHARLPGHQLARDAAEPVCVPQWRSRQVVSLAAQTDSGFLFYEGDGGKRQCYFDTSATVHAVEEPCFIIEPRTPGSPVAASGLPVFPLYYLNDDDGQRRLESDSQLTFTAGADGAYLVRMRDARRRRRTALCLPTDGSPAQA